MATVWNETDTDVLAPPELPAPGRAVDGGGPLDFGDRKVIPSLLERVARLAEDMDLEDPRIARMIAPSEAAAFAFGHGFGTEDLLEYLQGANATVFVQTSPLHRWIMRLRGFKPGDSIPMAEGYRIPVAELHCPDFPGCQTSYSSGRSSSDQIRLLVSARGAKAGGGIAGEVKIDQTVVTNGTCIQITVPGKIRAVPWTHDETGETIFDVQVTDLGSSWGGEEIPEWRRHDCGPHLESFAGALLEWERLGWVREGEDFVKHPLDVDGDMHVTRGWSRKSRGLFNLSILGILEIQSEFSTSHAFSYTLHSRNDYVAYYEDAGSEARFWSWKYASSTAAKKA